MTIDLTTATAEDVITALITLDGLAVPLAELHAGDRIIYRRHGVISDTIVADVHALDYHGWWSILTTAGDSWQASGKNRGQYRLP